MILLHAVAAAIVIACALHMVLSRNLVRILLGLALLATGTNLMLFVAGGQGGRQPPLIREGAKTLGVSADPTIQALILTAIVIGLALTVILATVVLRGWHATGSLDARDLDLVEPRPTTKPVEPS
ncbi:sodium:proton antiporter [Sphingomonas sp. Leaf62]|uniref:sodium:proton antiporter n=1 Tax=Sphingomonas sp. Leaf62 TaxID=1736228 RepID=UPI000AF3094F|nr:NADH-quinone oxidoreductase subunit K [Sphingomonas sp. Leaf62]